MWLPINPPTGCFYFPLKCLFVDHSSILSDRSVYSFLRWLVGWLSLVHFIPCLSFYLFFSFGFLYIFFSFLRSLAPSEKVFSCARYFDQRRRKRLTLFDRILTLFSRRSFTKCSVNIELLCNKYIPEWLNRHTAKKKKTHTHTHCVFRSIIFRTLSIKLNELVSILAVRFFSLQMPNETKNKRR